jgi:hypothetical protein
MDCVRSGIVRVADGDVNSILAGCGIGASGEEFAMSRGRWALVFALLAGALTGCDGKDPERLNRVGKKLVEKGRKASDDVQLPKVSVTLPEPEKADQKKP